MITITLSEAEAAELRTMLAEWAGDFGTPEPGSVAAAVLEKIGVTPLTPLRDPQPNVG